MATVFTLAGFFGVPKMMNNQLRGEVTAGNTIHPINYPSFGLDSLLLGLGPQIIPLDWMASINTGRDMLDQALSTTGGAKIVFGHSLGAVVAARWLADLGPTSPIDPDELSFILIGNSVRRYGGFLFHEEYAVPTDTRYPVKDIAIQYEGWCDWPNKWWDPNYLLAATNAIIGAGALHSNYDQVALSDPSYPQHVEGHITYIWAPTRPWWQPDYMLDLIETAYDRPISMEPLPVPVPASPLKIRYPAGPITPAGGYHLLAGHQPMMAYRSYDDRIVFNLMGPMAIPDPTRPETVILRELKGLFAPWKNIEQKAATQDGATYITSLYDPIEIDMGISVRARNASHRRKIMRHWIDSWDAKQPGELSWFTHEQGRWWSPVRWAKQPVDPITSGTFSRQHFIWTAIAYDGFWRSYDHVVEFPPAHHYEFDEDQFWYDTSDTGGLGPGWELAYHGQGGGYIYADGAGPHTDNGRNVQGHGEARWHSEGTPGNTVIARRAGSTSAGDIQLVTITLGSFSQWAYFDGAFNDIWARMATTGTPGDTGLRARFTANWIRLSFFRNGIETILRKRPLLVPPLPGETFTLAAGSAANLREYRILRNGATIMTVVEPGVGSALGEDYRGAGFGMHAGDGVPWWNGWDQAAPSTVRKWTLSDDASQTQTGFIERINCGDQPMWDRYTLYGPGVFTISDGPVDPADTTVEQTSKQISQLEKDALVDLLARPQPRSGQVTFGPLLAGQIVQIRTDPRKRAVIDLTSTPNSPNDIDYWKQALDDFLSYAAAGNVTMMLAEIESLFGIIPPQGNMYSLLNGRFSKPIPAKAPGKAAQKRYVSVAITAGDANSRIVAAGTPRRRFPD